MSEREKPIELDLKPCPFCGSEAQIYIETDPVFDPGVSILCQNDDCGAKIERGFSKPEGSFEAERKARADWNKRSAAQDKDIPLRGDSQQEPQEASALASDNLEKERKRFESARKAYRNDESEAEYFKMWNGEYLYGRVEDDWQIWQAARAVPADGETSDGYHTFRELYDYRKAFNALLFNTWADLGVFDVHKSTRHSDGGLCFGGGWFIVVAQLPTGQISNHYKLADWRLFNIPERETPAEYDGHTPQIALARMVVAALGQDDTETPQSGKSALADQQEAPQG